MEDTQVLNADSKAAPLQAPEAVDDNAFLNSIQPPQNTDPNPQIYKTNMPVVGEKNHANDIAMNVGSYDYQSKVDQSKEPTVTTQSTTKGNITDKKDWGSQYVMEDDFKATTDSDYSWNKIAADRSQYTYDQEATQVLSDYAKSMQEIKEAGAMAMDSYFSAAYTSNQTADKMGWQGGQVTSQDAKTAFLKASTAANMYSKFELQEYGLDSQLSVARMYAEANMEALALDLYQDELNKAISEAELTGYYISPEASEIMKQQKAAREILNKKNITDAERSRAEGVLSAGNSYFDKLGFSKDEKGNYIGVETLSNLEYQETVRANKENERLQQQANDIAEDAANDANSWAQKNYDLAEDQLQATKDQTAAINNMEAWKTYGGDQSTGMGNFVMVNGNYVSAGEVSKQSNGNYYGTVNGKKVVLKPNDNGYFEVEKEIDSSYGFFSNGYQPKGITGVGEVSKSGYSIHVEDKVNNKSGTQTLWTAPDGNYYVWDGVHNQYQKVSKNTSTYTILKK